MPFTLAHAVVALPFRRRRIPAAGVAAGAVVPDLPLFAPVGVPYAITHEVWAAPTVDVPLGLLLLVLWGVVLRPALCATAPTVVVVRLPVTAPRPSVPRPTPALLGAIAFGALTHVTWDAFTHQGRWGTQLLPMLNRSAADLPLASWAQYGSGLAGVALLAAVGAVSLRRIPPQDRASAPGAACRRAATTATVAAIVLGGLGGALSARGGRSVDLASAGAIGAIDASGAVLLVIGTVLGIRSTRL